MKNSLKVASVFMALIILSASFISCSSTTMINSDPQGAKLYMNGEYKGETPYKHTDSAISGATMELNLRKEGYEDLIVPLQKNEQVNVGAIVGGIFFLFPFIWTMGYNPSHNYELVPIQPPLLP